MKVDRRKIFSFAELLAHLADDRAAGRRIVFTNGCFDVLHVGHLRLLQQARAQGDVLVVAINSDASVRALGKGDDRPIHPQHERAEMLAAFTAVDYVTIFDEPTPLQIIELVQPDVLVKGGDWAADQIVGREFVEAHGGKVVRVPLVPEKSTTKIVERVRRE
jgi:D-beta-D-heptose 7-phosphate kinase/D-beta-D-heptose 1-phosphate adenosyltransferase